MRPVHFELPVVDQARAAAFYEKVFGWDIQQWEGAPYWLATTGPDTEAGINGALGQKSEDFFVPMFVIEVPNIDAAMLSVVEAGATIVHPKSPIPGVGYSAYFTDTEGNRMGLFETDESATIE
ncbi:MAG: VOC family protein [Acidimicrobiia bacterium]|nr:MAG: VOC family protein [Acidimicrobiia bacterium]